jgi:putative Mg2+ transporter-C (MgtC) family protein
MDFFFSKEIWDMIGRLLLAALLGGVIGVERDLHGRAAGLRTHILVSMGAGVFTLLSIYLSGSQPGAIRVGDPARVAAQIVTGIGFLGAGVIIREGMTIRGLTTAACLWSAAGIGMAAGAGYPLVACVATLIALFSLVILKYFEKLYQKDSYRILVITTDLDVEATRIIDNVKRKNISVIGCDIVRDYEKSTTVIRLRIRLFHKDMTDKLAHGIIKSLETAGIPLKQIEWKHL